MKVSLVVFCQAMVVLLAACGDSGQEASEKQLLDTALRLQVATPDARLKHIQDTLILANASVRLEADIAEGPNFAELKQVRVTQLTREKHTTVSAGLGSLLNDSEGGRTSDQTWITISTSTSKTTRYEGETREVRLSARSGFDKSNNVQTVAHELSPKILNIDSIANAFQKSSYLQQAKTHPTPMNTTLAVHYLFDSLQFSKFYGQQIDLVQHQMNDLQGSFVRIRSLCTGETTSISAVRNEGHALFDRIRRHEIASDMANGLLRGLSKISNDLVSITAVMIP